MTPSFTTRRPSGGFLVADMLPGVVDEIEESAPDPDGAHGAVVPVFMFCGPARERGRCPIGTEALQISLNGSAVSGARVEAKVVGATGGGGDFANLTRPLRDQALLAGQR